MNRENPENAEAQRTRRKIDGFRTTVTGPVAETNSDRRPLNFQAPLGLCVDDFRITRTIPLERSAP